MKRKDGLVKGQCVVVRPGVKDPDFDMDIGGWRGRVVSIRRDLVSIAWDSVTLQEMSDSSIARCEREGMDWTQMDLDVADVLPVEPRDEPKDVEATIRRLRTRHRYDAIGDEGEEISAVLADVGSDEYEALKAWQAYLQRALVFPFDAQVSEPEEYGWLDEGQIVRVHEIRDIDDLYGLIAKVKSGRRVYYLPLCDLKVTDRASPNYGRVQAYAVWFANR